MYGCNHVMVQCNANMELLEFAIIITTAIKCKQWQHITVVLEHVTCFQNFLFQIQDDDDICVNVKSQFTIA